MHARFFCLFLALVQSSFVERPAEVLPRLY